MALLIRPAASTDVREIWNLVATDVQKRGGELEFDRWRDAWPDILKHYNVYVACRDSDTPAEAVATVRRYATIRGWVCRGEVISTGPHYRRQLLGKIKDMARMLGAPVLEVGEERFVLNQGHGQQRGRGPA